MALQRPQELFEVQHEQLLDVGAIRLELQDIS
jgi:hypothetical protein